MDLTLLFNAFIAEKMGSKIQFCDPHYKTESKKPFTGHQSFPHHLILISFGFADLLEAELLEGSAEFGEVVVTLLVEGWEGMEFFEELWSCEPDAGFSFGWFAEEDAEHLL